MLACGDEEGAAAMAAGTCLLVRLRSVKRLSKT